MRCPIPLPRYARPKETWTRDRICDPGHSTLARGWGSQSFKAKTPILFVAVWLACGIFAAGDEFHLSFMPSRTVVSSDVFGRHLWRHDRISNLFDGLAQA